MRDHSTDRTTAVLASLSGGPALLAWMGGQVSFGDAELTKLCLDRGGSSVLRLRVQTRSRGLDEFAVVSFQLVGVIDLQIDGFSHQNVIDGLTLDWAPDRPLPDWNVGVGLQSGAVEIKLLPCVGASGTILAKIMHISVEPIPQPMKAT